MQRASDVLWQPAAPKRYRLVKWVLGLAAAAAALALINGGMPREPDIAVATPQPLDEGSRRAGADIEPLASECTRAGRAADAVAGSRAHHRQSFSAGSHAPRPDRLPGSAARAPESRVALPGSGRSRRLRCRSWCRCGCRSRNLNCCRRRRAQPQAVAEEDDGACADECQQYQQGKRRKPAAVNLSAFDNLPFRTHSDVSLYDFSHCTLLGGTL